VYPKVQAITASTLGVIMNDATLVIFRRWKDSGDIIALFPAIPADAHGWYCEAYERIGQHGGADYHGVIAATRPVTLEEAAPLAEELTRIGYRLVPIKRASRRVHDHRREAARRLGRV
jgi:hypothetical protein